MMMNDIDINIKIIIMIVIILMVTNLITITKHLLPIIKFTLIVRL